jgi:dTDP-4-dehydrorhamnose reductase
MQKIAVIGKTGQLAQALSSLENKENWIFFGRDEVDLSKSSELLAFLRDQSFDALINTAAYTAVDKAEEEKSIADQINGEAVGLMAKVCAEKKAVFIHVSTDYVFDGKANRPLREDQKTNPINHYGKSKLLGENLIQKQLDQHIIIRTSWLYGDQGHNFPKTMLKLASQHKKLNVVFDQVGNPTYAADLAAVIDHICSIESLTSKQFGTFHYSNEGVCSWYDFAVAAIKKHHPKTQIFPVTSEEFPTPASRPPYSVLNKKKIKDSFGITTRHWQDALTDFLEKLEL